MDAHDPKAGRQQQTFEDQAANVAELQNLKSGRQTHGKATAPKLQQSNSDPVAESEAAPPQTQKRMKLRDLSESEPEVDNEETKQPVEEELITVSSGLRGGASLAAKMLGG